MSGSKNKPTSEQKKKAKGPKLSVKDEVFDASPNSDGKKPKNIRETKGWNQGVNGLKGFFQAYLNILGRSFNNMNRFEQEQLISRFCVVITVGIACVALNCFYSLLILPIKVVSLPIVLGLAWIAALKLITPIVVTRLSKYLQKN